MSNITLAQGSIMLEQFGNIRTTDDGWLSIYDLIKVVGGQKNPYDVWSRLNKAFEADLAKCETWKFPGERQQNTPICDKETALKIIGLLPGVAGKKYRDLAAKLVLSYLENPDQLAKAAIARTNDEVELEGIAQAVIDKVKQPEKLLSISEAARAKYLALGYHPHMDNISSRLDFPDDRVSFMRINKATTQAVTGKEPKQIQAEHYTGQAKKPPSARKLMNEDELKWTESCHQVQSGTLTARNTQGSEAVVDVCVEAAAEFQAMLIKLGVLK